MELQGALGAVPRDRRAVEPVILAAGPAGAQAPPLPLQLTLHLGRGQGNQKWELANINSGAGLRSLAQPSPLGLLCHRRCGPSSSRRQMTKGQEPGFS